MAAEFGLRLGSRRLRNDGPPTCACSRRGSGTRTQQSRPEIWKRKIPICGSSSWQLSKYRPEECHLRFLDDRARLVVDLMGSWEVDYLTHFRLQCVSYFWNFCTFVKQVVDLLPWLNLRMTGNYGVDQDERRQGCGLGQNPKWMWWPWLLFHETLFWNLLRDQSWDGWCCYDLYLGFYSGDRWYKMVGLTERGMWPMHWL